MGRQAGKTATLGGGEKTITVALVDAIRRRILDGGYATGEKLPQDKLAAEFGISRIPVREALFQLDAEGLVTIEPQRGATVSPLSPERMRETLELRAMLEPYLLRHSAPLLTADDRVALASQLDDYQAAIDARQVDRWGELNTAFHLGLYARAGRPRALGIVATLLRESDRYTRVQLAASAAYQRRAQKEHRALLALCEQGEWDAAGAAMEAHIRHVLETLSEIVTSRTG